MTATLEELAAAGAVIAEQLANLHERGQVHGAVDAEHTTLSPPAAVGLKAGESTGRGRGTPDADVAGLGRLLLDAMGAGDPFACLRLALSARERGGWRRYLRLPRPVSPAAALKELALEAAAATADGPTAADLSKRLSRLSSGHARPAGRVPVRVVGVAGIAVLAAVLLLAWSTLRPTVADDPPPQAAQPVLPSPPQEPAAPDEPAEGVAEEAAPAPADRMWPPPPPAPRCPPTAPPSADVDGDGCPEPVEVSSGIIRSGSRRWAVGSPGDVIVLGDWNCDRTTTPAVLRPATGGLFVFDRWTTSVEPQRARPVRVVPGAVGLEPRGCGHAAVQLSDRAVVVVETGDR